MWNWKAIGLFLGEVQACQVVERYAPTIIPNSSLVLAPDSKQDLLRCSNAHVGLLASLLHY